MDSHTTGRAKDAWRQRNAGAEAPGDGQNVPRYSDPGLFAAPVGLPVTDSRPAESPRATSGGITTVRPSVRVHAPDGPELASPPETGLSAEEIALVRPRGRPRKGS